MLKMFLILFSKFIKKLLKNKKINEIYNVCGGSKISLKDLINLIQKFTKKIKIKT